MRKFKIKPSKLLIYLVLIVIAITFVFPYIWLVASSLKPNADIFSPSLSLLPSDGKFNFQNYIEAMQYLGLSTLFKNTLIVATVNTLLNLLLNSMAGYAFAKLDFKGRDVIFRIMIMAMMIPGTVMLIPNLIIVNKLGVYDSLGALILPFAMSIYNIFLLRQNFMGISNEIIDAAKIDGAGQFKIFFSICLPLVKQILAVLGLTTFMWNYNNFLWPLVAVQSEGNMTLAMGLGSLVAAGKTNPEIYPVMLAGSVIVSLPLILLTIVCQKQIVGGITAGAVKE